MSYPLTKIVLLKWAAKGCKLRTFEELTPLTKIAMQEWVVKGCNVRTFEELTPLTKIAMQEWVAMIGLLKTYPLTKSGVKLRAFLIRG